MENFFSDRPAGYKNRVQPFKLHSVYGFFSFIQRYVIKLICDCRYPSRLFRFFRRKKLLSMGYDFNFRYLWFFPFKFIITHNFYLLVNFLRNHKSAKRNYALHFLICVTLLMLIDGSLQ